METQPVLADLVVNGVPRGSVEFSLAADGSLLIPTATIQSSLAGIAKRETLDRLASGDLPVSSATLADAGIRCAFDEAALILKISVDPGSMESAAFPSVSPGRFAQAEKNALRPEPFSAIAGIGFGVVPRYDMYSPVGAFSVSGDVTLSPSINLGRFVLDGTSTIAWADGSFSNSVDAARAIVDFPSAGTRLAAGLVENRPAAFQGKAKLLGLSYNRESGFPGSDARARTDSDDVVIRHPATVSVEVNGSSIRTEKLPPGTWHLSDLPLSAGLNDVTIRIDEEGEPVRLVRLGIPFDASVLSPGETDFSAVLGVDRETFTRPFGSFWLSVGLFRSFELGADLEGTPGNFLGGLSALWATPLGNFALGDALSAHYDDAFVLAFVDAEKFSWRFSSGSRQFLPRLGVAVERRGAGFSPPQETGDAAIVFDSPTIRLSAQVTEALPAGAGSVSLFGDSTFLDASIVAAVVQAGYFLSVRNLVSLSVSAGFDWRESGDLSPRAAIVVAFSPPRAPMVQYRNDPLSRSDSLDASMSLDREGNASLGAHISNLVWMAGSDISAGLSGRLASRIGDLAVSAQYASDVDAASSTIHGSLSGSTNLVFGGGQFALAPARSDTFALLVPDRPLSGKRVILRSSDGSETESRSGGSTTIDGLSLYRPYVATVELPASDADKTAVPSSVVLVPVYKSVTVVRVRLASSIVVRGFISDGQGKPRAGLTGDLFDAALSPVPSAGTFTDEAGVFECYGLDIGSYTVKWSDGSVSHFDVPSGAIDGGTVDLGTVAAEKPADGKGGEQ
jgi:outer membrane usher protein FimD/PapC